MPDQFGRKTPQELLIEQQQQAAAQGRMSLASGMDSGMIMPTRTPEQMAAMNKSFKGEEGKIKSQRAMAQQLRGQGMPQGREVGPLNVYQAPNWGESLAGATNILAGAWMGKQANDRDVELDADRTQAALEKAIYAQDMDKYADDVRKEGLTYARGRDATADDQWQKTFEYNQNRDKVGDEQWESEYAADVSELEPQPYKDLDGIQRYVTRMPDPDDKRKFINLDENGEVVDIKGWEKVSPYGRGSYTSSTRKNPTTWIDDAGNVKYTYTIGETEYDRDTNEPMKAGWISDGKFTKTTLMSEGKKADELEALGKRFGPTLDMMDRVERADEAAFTDPETGEYVGPEEGETRFSWLTKQRNALGGAARIMSDVMNGDAEEGVKFATAMDLVNAVMRARVGLSQTVTEQANIFLEAGMDVMSKPEVFEAWWRNMEDALYRDMRMIEATTSPVILEIYQRNQGRIDGGDSVLGGSGGRGGGGGQMSRNNNRSSLEAEEESLRRELEELGG